MNQRFRKITAHFTQNVWAWSLAFVLFSGYLLGTLFSAEASDSYIALMRMSAVGPVSIVSVFASAMLPFLFAFIAVNCKKPFFLLAVCFCKAFFIAHCSFGCYLAFGSGGWLVRLLLQFSDLLLMPVLCWFAVCYLQRFQPLKVRDVLICATATLAVSAVNVCFVSPYLAMLIDT